MRFKEKKEKLFKGLFGGTLRHYDEKVLFSGHLVYDFQSGKIIDGSFNDGQGPYGSLKIKGGRVSVSEGLLEVILPDGPGWEEIKLVLKRDETSGRWAGEYFVRNPYKCEFIGRAPPQQGEIIRGHFISMGEAEKEIIASRYPAPLEESKVL